MQFMLSTMPQARQRPFQSVMHQPKPINQNMSAEMLHYQSLLWTLYYKQDQLCSYVEPWSANIVLRTETWLSPDITDSEFSLSHQYTLFRRERLRLQGLDAYIVHTYSCLEILWAAFCLPPCVTCVTGVCYCPPDYSDKFPEFLNESNFYTKQVANFVNNLCWWFKLSGY